MNIEPFTITGQIGLRMNDHSNAFTNPFAPPPIVYAPPQFNGPFPPLQFTGPSARWGYGVNQR
eukprot:UN08031